MRAAIGPNYVLAPSSDPHLLPLSFQEQLSPLVPFPCHPLKVSSQRIAGVCLGGNDTMTFTAGHLDIWTEGFHPLFMFFYPKMTRAAVA
jgi:hypothetical protein